jgi:hypothetical protein
VTDTGLNKQTYIDIAADLGYTITIIEFTPFWCGMGKCGDPIGDQNNIFYWQVNVYMSPETFESWVYFTSGSSQCGDPLIYVPLIGILQCVLNTYKPAWTKMILAFFGPGYSQAYSEAYNSILANDPVWFEGAYGRGFSTSYDIYTGGGAYGRGYDSSYYKQL